MGGTLNSFLKFLIGKLPFWTQRLLWHLIVFFQIRVGYSVGRYRINIPMSSLIIIIIFFVLLYLTGTEGIEDIYYLSSIVILQPQKNTSKYTVRYWKVSKLSFPSGSIITNLLEKFFNNELIPNKNYKIKITIDY